MSHRRRLAPALAALAVAAAAVGCGGDSGSGSGEPIKIAWMGAETGEYATKDRHYAIDLAIADINAKGGIGGRKVEYKAYDGGLTPQQGLTAVKKALADKPAAIIGLATTAQVKATAPLLKSAGIPTLHVAQSHTLGKSTLKVDNVFRYGPTEAMQTHALTDYIVTTAKPKKVGLLASTDPGSEEAARLLRAGLTAGGVANIVERRVPQTATDLTEAVLAFRGVDATVTWSFPTIDSLFLRQRGQNGLTAPTFGDNSGGSILGGRLNPPAELKGYHYVIACDPDLSQAPEAQAYVAAYKKKYGPSPTNPQLAQGYDAFRVLAAAIEKAGGTDPKALTKALGAVTHQGVCGTYKADEENDLYHSDVIIDAEGGLTGRKLLKTYDGLTSRAG
ncbi:ABC transporter substrate-binding protein [Actinomadura chibensis]|uniref:ABC transporter substrate-binding protein n=1 Tax=Actinomadura chibensis TaxID=392828 RepID=A0A5D0NCT6_9ACTN|nr:ABC transporter substrate-binding protein [Actinomadura chibensis]TYB42324.1 ABC transporter substrate-binding protein [Actinomadura chibensis]